MKINPKDLQRDEVGAFIMNNGVKQYVRRKLDINKDSKVGQVDFGGANINPEFIKPSSNEEVISPKELPGRDVTSVNKSSIYNSYKPKIPVGKNGGGYVAPIPKDLQSKIPGEDYSKMISYEPGQSKMVKEENSPSGFKNFVGGVLNATTELPALLGKGIGRGVGAIAKMNPYVDDATVDKYVKSREDELDNNRSNYIGEDQNSKGFTAGVVTANVVPLLAGGAAIIGKQGLKQGLNATSAFNNIGKNAGKGTVNVNKIPTYKGVETPLNIDKLSETGKYSKEAVNAVKPTLDKIGGLGNIKYASQNNMQKLMLTYNKLKEASAFRSLSAGEKQLMEKTLKLMNG